MNTVEVVFPDIMEFVKLKSNGIVLSEETNCKRLYVDTIVLPTTVEVEFSPYRVKPIVRYNNFMLDYWLANIQLFDHKLEFAVSENFYSNYKSKNIQGRIDSLSDQQKLIDHYWDKYIGVDNLHLDLVEQIKKLIQ